MPGIAAINLKYGLMLNNPDRAVVDKWEHRPFESFKYALSGHVSFPPTWRQLRFLAGAEFQYITAKEELSGSYTATIDITITQLLIFGGMEWRPWWAKGFGAGFTTGFKVQSEKKAKLDAQGFTEDLGNEEAKENSNVLGMPLLVGLSVFYELGNWRPMMVLESDAALTAGVGYVF